VLIHAAAGGVGLAAVQIAQRCGAEIFGTAGSDEKREYLHGAGVKHVMDSRSLAYREQIFAQTNGEGVDVVLNSLPGQHIGAGLSVLRPYGRFVEIGRTDIYQNALVGLAPFKNNLSYFSVDLDQLCRDRGDLVQSMFEEIVKQFERGSLRPLHHRAFALEEAPAAFRYMLRRENIGKIVFSVPTASASSAAPGRREGTWVVTGGTGGIGSRVAAWLVERGARSVLVISRSGASGPKRAVLEALASSGADVRILKADVSRRDELAAALEWARTSMAPIRGVIHAAGVLRDRLILNMDDSDLREVAAAKVLGAWNLHELTQEDELECFVLFSSIAGLFGSPGQGNYAAANAFLDALAHRRRAAGLPATALDWGPWAEVGMAAAEDVRRRMKERGIDSFSVEEGLQALEVAIERDSAQVVVIRADWEKLVTTHSGAEERLEELASPRRGGAAPDLPERAKLLALPAEERQAALIERLQREIVRITGLTVQEIPPDEPLADLGLDSLMTLELRDNVESALDVALGAEHLQESPTLASLAEVILRELDRSRA
jgi:NADPH:quinone reductase-like Zn-dependent oxidoreductase/acyl carrier protein